ncbi:MAG: FAD:protein FMN transferase [Oscillospiraceae bacterium]|nr:FAD:protein FMN transferase [Oscillospiraceae bacterium]
MKKRISALIFAMVLLLAGCAAKPEESASRTVFAMDTIMNLTVYASDPAPALDAAVREIYRLDAMLARGTEGSEVYRYNHGGAREGELDELLTLAENIRDSSGGAFDPYLGALLDLWGFGSGAGEHRVPSDEELADVSALLDLGGIAKGYAGQRVLEVLKKNGVSRAVVDLGGDVALLGKKPDGSDWHVAIRDPGEGNYLGILSTSGSKYIATSGVYERFFEENGIRYHHILDPRTGRPAESGLVSATVICESGVWADALATAVCVLGVEDSLALRDSLADTVKFDIIIVTEDGRAIYTCDGLEPDESSGYAFERAS